jgi:hypothetical protein
MAGELRYQNEPIPVPPKQPPASTLYHFKRREEQRRKGEILSPLAQQALENPEAVRERIIQRAVSIWDYEQERLEEQRSKGRVDNGLFSRQLKNAPTVMAMLKAMSNQQKSNKPGRDHGREAEPAPEPEQPDELASLINAHDSTRRGVAA